MIFIFLLLTTCISRGFSQENGRSYVVLSFVEEFKVGQHSKRAYFWIIPVDSLMSYEAHIAKVFLADFTKNNVDSCCENKAINPFVVMTDTNFEIENELKIELSNLIDIVISRKKKIETIIRRNWNTGQKQTVSVFATPIHGEFCYSPYTQMTRTPQNEYNGLVYLPLRKFRYDDSFWKSSKAQYVLKRSYYAFPYAIIFQSFLSID
jgi:hypothetical protein